MLNFLYFLIFIKLIYSQNYSNCYINYKFKEKNIPEIKFNQNMTQSKIENNYIKNANVNDSILFIFL